MYGEGMKSGSVITVKTHKSFAQWTAPDHPESKVCILVILDTLTNAQCVCHFTDTSLFLSCTISIMEEQF